jgi:hypothetical protein
LSQIGVEVSCDCKCDLIADARILMDAYA